jgi:cytochrome oxidase assembly protein ShyY1
MSKQEFDEKWMYHPLAIRGIFDHSKETLVTRTRFDERGFEVVTPLYTKVNLKNGELSGMFVNRGRIPIEFRDSKMHHTGKEEQVIEGVLMCSEEDTAEGA